MEGECRGRGFLGPHDSTDVLKRSYWLGASFNLLLWAQNNRTPVPVQLFCQAGSFLGVASCAIHCDLLHLVQHVHLLWGFLPTASSRENVVKYCFWDKVIVSKFFPRCFYLIPDSGRYARYFFKKSSYNGLIPEEPISMTSRPMSDLFRRNVLCLYSQFCKSKCCENTVEQKRSCLVSEILIL